MTLSINDTNLNDTHLNDRTGPTTMSSLRSLIADARYEVVPLKNLEGQLAYIPEGSSVSVTCSPAKGQQATLDLTLRLQDLGHVAIPHVSARLAEDLDAVKMLGGFCRDHELKEMFIIAGDAPEPSGPYDGVVAFLRDFLDTDHRLERIGIAAYPDGHAFLDPATVHEALHTKQAMLAEAGVAGFASTQMCFDLAQWKKWAAAERAAGFDLPLHIGVPGVIDRTKLFTMGMRLGIGNSMRYVKKNSGTLSRLFRPGGYDPNKLIVPLAKQADELGIAGIHLFTFNNVQATAEWQQKMLAKLS